MSTEFYPIRQVTWAELHAAIRPPLEQVDLTTEQQERWVGSIAIRHAAGAAVAWVHGARPGIEVVEDAVYIEIYGANWQGRSPILTALATHLDTTFVEQYWGEIFTAAGMISPIPMERGDEILDAVHTWKAW